jgi:PhzF family phenazine biosynthesis protein
MSPSSSRHRPFKQVDVFTSVPFLGNPVAVVLDAQGLSTEEMQRIARWTNLSETTFVLPPTSPQADYRLRIFTPGSELPFAGHPTIGTAHALLEAGRVTASDGRLTQECGLGLVALHVNTQPGGTKSIAFELPIPSVEALTDPQVEGLGGLFGGSLPGVPRPRLVDVGARWIVVQLPDASAVLSARPDMNLVSALSMEAGATGVLVFGAYAPGQKAQVEVRAFAPLFGIQEDPVCGSGNGCMAVFIRETGQVERFGSVFVASQGQVVGRDGRLEITIAPDRIQVGGSAVTCIDGQLNC